MAKSKHVCPKPKPGQYEWPCRVCHPRYYEKNPNVRWYLHFLPGCVDPELRGPYRSEYGMEKAARRLQDSGEFSLDTDHLGWLRQEGQRLCVGPFVGKFFEKEESDE